MIIMSHATFGAKSSCSKMAAGGHVVRATWTDNPHVEGSTSSVYKLLYTNDYNDLVARHARDKHTSL